MSDLLKRKGQFEITRRLIKESPEGVLKVLKNVLVVHIVDNYINDSMIYFGYSPHFDIVEDFQDPPVYRPIINKSDGNISVEWIRQDTYSKNEVKSLLAEIKEEIKNTKA